MLQEQMRGNTNSAPMEAPGQAFNARVARYAFGEELEGPLAEPFDVVLASDLAYSEKLFKPLLRSFALLASRNAHLQILLSHKVRYETQEKRFFHLAKKKFQVEQMELGDGLSVKYPSIRVFRLSIKQKGKQEQTKG